MAAYRRAPPVRAAAARNARRMDRGRGAGAALRALVARMPVGLWRFLVGFCTVVLLLAPLLLWVSWTRSGFIAVMVSAAVALVIAYLLVRHAPEHRKL